MKNEKLLNQKAIARIIEDLIMAGFIKSSIRTEKTTTMNGSLKVNWTKKGTLFISQYAEALSSLRHFDKRDREMFHLFLDRNAVDYLDGIPPGNESRGD